VKLADSITKLPKNANPANLVLLQMEQPHYPNVNPAQQELLLLIKTVNNVLLVKLVATRSTTLTVILALLEPFLQMEQMNAPHANQDTCLIYHIPAIVRSALQEVMKLTEQLAMDVP